MDLLALAAVARPEVEIRDGAGLALGLDLQGAGSVARGIAVTGFGNLPGHDAHANVRVGAAAAGALIEACVLGSGAAGFADPGPGARSGGDNLRAIGGDGGIVRNSLIGFAAGNGVALTRARTPGRFWSARSAATRSARGRATASRSRPAAPRRCAAAGSNPTRARGSTRAPAPAR